ncbi:MAG: hypothetical protein MRT15_03900 [archaeon YNP-LCB-003-016]|uniref:hypothetical protein n=1 Tax=Candidatus Culexarchaeum yellowstonense TaxID=2928963 RepID=UPI0026EB59B3|nr:hypothetical protein [Candidatus Culexarchaeum yellowstonense]MCR6691511.1 hypothetical protein [Candidatus Culexarchaeum yellowstonense]
MNEWLYAAIGILGAIIGVIVHYAYILWQRRDIISWTLDYWEKAWSDRKITVDEAIQFIEGLIDRLGLKDKVIFQRKTETSTQT